MKTIIRKRPSPDNFDKRSLSLTKDEFDIVQNDNLDSEIHVYEHRGDDEPTYKISKKKYEKLVAVPRTARSFDGVSSQFFVVDFSKAISK